MAEVTKLHLPHLPFNLYKPHWCYQYSILVTNYIDLYIDLSYIDMYINHIVVTNIDWENLHLTSCFTSCDNIQYIL